jgi:hypothetical protein
MQIIEHSVIGTRSAILRMRQRDLGLEFVIFPMLHVAAPEFYHEVAKRLKRCDLLVLEGVGATDGEHRSAQGSVVLSALTLTYRVMPWLQRGRMVVDPIRYRSLGVPFICPDFTTEDVAGSFGRRSWKFRIQLMLLVPVAVVLNLFGADRRLLSPSAEVNDLSSPEDEAMSDSEFGEQFDEFLGGERDGRVTAALADLVRRRGHERIDVAVVYGAGHTAAIVDALFPLGYRLRRSDWVMLFPV